MALINDFDDVFLTVFLLIIGCVYIMVGLLPLACTTGLCSLISVDSADQVFD